MNTTSSLRPWIPVVAALLLAGGLAGAQQGYQKPPRQVLDVLRAPPTPQVVVAPTRDRLLLLHGEHYPPVAELAQPMLRLAGLRINPANNAPHRPPRITDLTVLTLATGKKEKPPLPFNRNIGAVTWAPNGKQYAFTQTTATSVELWVQNPLTGDSFLHEDLALNTALGAAPLWMPDSQTLLCQVVPPRRGKPPEVPRVPPGPTIQESDGKPSPVRTFQDLLQNAHDEALFDYYATSQIFLYDTSKGKVRPVGAPAIFSSVTPSPDGKLLLVARLHRPYSYLLPLTAFPRAIEVWDLDGKVIHKVASLPLADRVPIEGVRTGPRQVHWRGSEPATLCWAEALDEGDPRKQVPHRDALYLLKAPFESKPGEFFRTRDRFTGVTWDEKDSLALVAEYDRNRRWERTHLLDTNGTAKPRLVWDLSVHDRYNDPGSPVLRTLPGGHRVLHRHEGRIYLAGSGSSPQGDRPFLDALDLQTLKTSRLFHCAPKSYESVVALLSDDGSRVLTRHESPTEPPNYFLRTAGEKKALTDLADPAPQLRGVTRKLVTYKRADGVPLSFTLYLPPGYKEGQRLPAVLWAYPREYTDARTAGQVVGSPFRFTTFTGPTHLFFLAQGYAILDGATMPVVGDPETANNTFVEQIVASAKAAIDKADEMGVIDRQRVGVGGHSYGAFMTANLLAHSDLFRAGIARSGAYNRTLTPFGFQSERRTLWEAPEVYIKVSPFLHAHKIKQPLLLIHGEADNNSGTFPIQSERLYHALKGNGGTARYVVLPFESHGYAARESVEHALYEMLSWFDRHVKNAPTPGGRNR
ncbi:MAG: prolyl oligopeptidase family serine peptidase [Gemmataceae bacterium]|nr:prolyl oligopeptidase family serine peptidase [Gemmataceae bacterium]